MTGVSYRMSGRSVVERLHYRRPGLEEGQDRPHADHDTAEAKAFYDCLTGAEAAAVFDKYGFNLLH